MAQAKILPTFPNDPRPPEIIEADGLYVCTGDGQRYLDLTSGFTGHSVLGWGDQSIIDSINKQLCKIGHIDYKMYSDPNRDRLASLLLDSASHSLDRLFSGSASMQVLPE